MIEAKIDEVDNFFVSWSDMITLLLVLFAYIVSISTIDSVKLQEASSSITNQLAGESSTIVEADDLDVLLNTLQSNVQAKNLGEKVTLSKQADRIFIQIKQDLLFDQGEVDIKSKADTVLAVLARSFKEKSYFVSIEGHTDNVPIHTNKFENNWALSSIRAVEVLDFLVKHGVNPRHLRAIGYADTRPLVPNDTSENRGINRRVTFVVESFQRGGR
ncbi:MAG: OmpA family protein [bacterium]